MDINKKIEWTIENHKYGQEILNNLNKYNDQDLKSKLNEITNYRFSELLINNCDCIRTIRNSEVESIVCAYFDKLIVTTNGISYGEEHCTESLIVKFDKQFYYGICKYRRP